MIKRGEIYVANLGEFKGSEQCGIRPVLIIQNDMGNKHSPTTIVASITSKLDKHKLPTHIEIKDGMRKKSVILLEQIKTIDKERLGTKICELSEEDLKQVDEALRISLGVLI